MIYSEVIPLIMIKYGLIAPFYTIFFSIDLIKCLNILHLIILFLNLVLIDNSYTLDKMIKV